MDVNIDITSQEIEQIRCLSDFDLKMFLSEIHDHGWAAARDLLGMIQKASPDASRERVTG